MTEKIPDEVVVARLSIEAARIALEGLLARLSVTPRSEKVIVTDTLHESCARLKAAQELLVQLERVAFDKPA